MQTFASKATPGADKLRGGYYTPQPLARFVAEWVAAAGPRLLEPACGDGAILGPLVDAAGPGASVVGVELLAEKAEAASRRAGVAVTSCDFFAWFDKTRHGAFDGVAGNPPYIRFGSWDEAQRGPALEVMRWRGMRPNRLTNAWVPFVVASLLALRPGRRVGLVLPAEVLQVGYAAELRAHLVDECEQLTVVSFERLVFPGIQQEVVLLLAEHGPGPARVRTVELPDTATLAGLRLDSAPFDTAPAVRAGLHATEKWTRYYLKPSSVEAVRRLARDPRFAPLRRYGEVDVGVVTGRNSFFCLTAPDAARRGLDDVTVPLVSRSAQLRGLVFTDANLDEAAGDARTRLLATPADTDPATRTRIATRPRIQPRIRGWPRTWRPARPTAFPPGTNAASDGPGGGCPRSGCPTHSCSVRSRPIQGWSRTAPGPPAPTPSTVSGYSRAWTPIGSRWPPSRR